MNTDDHPLVSVVTPVYNGENCLAKCIESVLTQTYSSFEYIIVDNCSTDRTFEIADTYRRRDARIQIHRNTKHVSVIENHHVAFGQLSERSKYCKVVHADDWLFPECLAEMIGVAELHPSVGLVGAYCLDENRVKLGGLPYPSTVVTGREVCRPTLLGHLYVFGSPSSLLIRSDLIRKRPVFYDELSFPRHADTAACYEILQHVDFGFVHQVLTVTTRPKESGTSFSRRVNSYIVENLFTTLKYGPVYLSGVEYQQRLKVQTIYYYRFLGKNVWTRRDKEFWDYHKNAMKTLGFSHSSLRVFKAALIEAVINGLNALGRLLRKAE
jgi:glycosyltransferase involved in cell wall biosynthesis